MSGDGAKYLSVGTIDAPRDAEFYYGGTPTPMGEGSAISMAEAHAAASEFLRTGKRPTSATWATAD